MKLEVLKKRKKELRLTNKDVADRSGVSLGTVNKIFSGATKAPQIDTMKAILNVLHLEEYQFYDSGAGQSGFLRRRMTPNAEQDAAEAVMTAEEYMEMPGRERTELVEGRVVCRESPAWNHQELVSGVVCMIRSRIAEKGYDYHAVCGPIEVRLAGADGDTIVRPDLVMLTGKEKVGPYGLEDAPDFIMEVLSKDGQERDLIIKPDLYMEAGIKEYWAVNLYEKQVMSYWFGSNYGENGFQMRAYSFSEAVPLHLLDDFSITFDTFELL